MKRQREEEEELKTYSRLILPSICIPYQKEGGYYDYGKQISYIHTSEMGLLTGKYTENLFREQMITDLYKEWYGMLFWIEYIPREIFMIILSFLGLESVIILKKLCKVFFEYCSFLYLKEKYIVSMIEILNKFIIELGIFKDVENNNIYSNWLIYGNLDKYDVEVININYTWIYNSRRKDKKRPKYYLDNRSDFMDIYLKLKESNMIYITILMKFHFCVKCYKNLVKQKTYNLYLCINCLPDVKFYRSRVLSEIPTNDYSFIAIQPLKLLFHINNKKQLDDDIRIATCDFGTIYYLLRDIKQYYKRIKFRKI